MAAIDDMQPSQQGAEARVYVSEFYGRPCIIKERFVKTYRVPELDQKLTQRRISQEVRSMARCCKQGIRTPAVYFVDQQSRCIYMEYVQDGILLKEYINQNLSNEDELKKVMKVVAQTVATMHQVDVIHGDLTTSNMFYHPLGESITLIDFGLSCVSTLVEDKGVDLYVLERAFLSTHPTTQELFSELLRSYGESGSGCKSVLAKLDEVRMRGRKRTMVG